MDLSKFPPHVALALTQFAEAKAKGMVEKAFEDGKRCGREEVLSGLNALRAFLPQPPATFASQLAAVQAPVMLSQPAEAPVQMYRSDGDGADDGEFDLDALVEQLSGEDDPQTRQQLLVLMYSAVVEAYKAKGEDPEPVLAKLRELAGEGGVEAAMGDEAVWMAWVPAQTKSGKPRADWDGEGGLKRKPLYGDAAERALRTQDSRGHSSYEASRRKGVARERRDDLVAKLDSGELFDEQDWEDFSGHLQSLPGKEVAALRKKVMESLMVSTRKGVLRRGKTAAEMRQNMTQGVSRLIQHAIEQAELPDPSPSARSGHVSHLVAKFGGLKPQDDEFARQFGMHPTEAVKNGYLPRNAVHKNGRRFSDMAEEFRTEGHVYPSEGQTDEEALYEAISGGRRSAQYDTGAEQEEKNARMSVRDRLLALREKRKPKVEEADVEAEGVTDAGPDPDEYADYLAATEEDAGGETDIQAEDVETPAGDEQFLTMGKDEFSTNPPKGFAYRPSLPNAIAEYAPDGRIILTDAFFEHSPEDRKHIVAHERAHGVVKPITSDAEQFWPLVDSGVAGRYDEKLNRFVGSINHARNADEVLTEAVAQVQLDPERLKESQPGMYVIAQAVTAGEKITPELIRRAKDAAGQGAESGDGAGGGVSGADAAGSGGGGARTGDGAGLEYVDVPDAVRGAGGGEQADDSVRGLDGDVVTEKSVDQMTPAEQQAELAKLIASQKADRMSDRGGKKKKRPAQASPETPPAPAKSVEATPPADPVPARTTPAPEEAETDEVPRPRRTAAEMRAAREALLKKNAVDIDANDDLKDPTIKSAQQDDDVESDPELADIDPNTPISQVEAAIRGKRAAKLAADVAAGKGVRGEELLDEDKGELQQKAMREAREKAAYNRMARDTHAAMQEMFAQDGHVELTGADGHPTFLTPDKVRFNDAEGYETLEIKQTIRRAGKGGQIEKKEVWRPIPFSSLNQYAEDLGVEVQDPTDPRWDTAERKADPADARTTREELADVDSDEALSADVANPKGKSGRKAVANDASKVFENRLNRDSRDLAQKAAKAFATSGKVPQVPAKVRQAFANAPDRDKLDEMWDRHVRQLAGAGGPGPKKAEAPASPAGVLTEGQRKSVDAYVAASSEINTALRTGDMAGIDADAKARIDELDGLLGANKIAATKTVFRGVGSSYLADAAKQLGVDLSDPSAVGKSFTDRGFVSTSNSEQAATKKFAQGKERSLVRIEVPPGTPGLDLNAAGGRATEDEFLMGRGLTFTVVGHEKRPGRKAVTVLRVEPIQSTPGGGPQKVTVDDIAGSSVKKWAGDEQSRKAGEFGTREEAVREGERLGRDKGGHEYGVIRRGKQWELYERLPAGSKATADAEAATVQPRDGAMISNTSASAGLLKSAAVKTGGPVTANYTAGVDRVGIGMAKEAGYLERPRVVAGDEMDRLRDEGWFVGFRGVPDPDNHESHRRGDTWLGNGANGTGIYTAYTPPGRVRNDAAALREATSAGGSHVTRFALPPTAKVVPLSKLKDDRDKDLARLRDERDRGEITTEQHDRLVEVLADNGRYAISKGYDGISIPERGHMMVLNRSIAAVQADNLNNASPKSGG